MSALAELLERTEPLAEDVLAEVISGHPLRDVLLTILGEIRGSHAPEPQQEAAGDD